MFLEPICILLTAYCATLHVGREAVRDVIAADPAGIRRGNGNQSINKRRNYVRGSVMGRSSDSVVHACTYSKLGMRILQEKSWITSRY